MPTKTNPKAERPRKEPFTTAPDAKVTAGDLADESQTEGIITASFLPGRPPIAGEPQEVEDHGFAVKHARGDMTVTVDRDEPARRTDTIPEMQARVLAVMDLSQAFGFGTEDFGAAIVAAVNEEHTESDANCWCGKLHPKERKEAKHGDGN